MSRRIWSLFALIMMLAGCKSGVNEPFEEPPEEPPGYVHIMQGAWKFDASLQVTYNSQTFTCDINDATIDVGQMLNSKYPFYFAATMKGSKLRCKQDSVLQWEAPLDSVSINVWRAMFILGIDFKIPTPFGELWLDCQAGWYQDEIIDADKWTGRVSQHGKSMSSYAVDVHGTWTSTRRP